MRKFLVILAVIFSCVSASAYDSVELLGGGLTVHMENANSVGRLYDHQLNSKGLIDNPTFGVVMTHDDGHDFHSYTVFAGEESVGGLMYGGMYETGRVFFKDLQFGLAFGAYAQDDNDFRAAHVVPVSMELNHSDGIVPVIGLATNYKVKLSEATYAKVNTIISPMISNVTFSLGLNF